jgi:prepilin-type N-terminal cleavage/methylation domain-containing protein
MKSNNKLKGFTLVELIVVMAIFGILMTAVMRVLTPLNKLSKRASVQEANAAAVDNMKSYLENSLRYADCIETCVGGLTDDKGRPFADYNANDLTKEFGIRSYDGSTKVTPTAEEAAIINFIDGHFTNRAKPGTDSAEPLEGTVRMLKIDNKNGGKITEYEWDFESGYTFTNYFDAETEVGGVTYPKGAVKVKVVTDPISGLPETDPNTGDVIVENDIGRVNATISNKRVTEDVINPAYYENYAFYIAPGYNELDTITDESSVLGFGEVENNSDDYYAMIKPVTKEIDDGSGGTTKFQYTDESKFFNKDMFSLSVITFKNDTFDDGAVGESYVNKGTCTDEDGKTRVAFHSPFAVTNTNMSLVNINSVFSQGRAGSSGVENWGPVRYNGPKDDNGKDYTPTDLVDSGSGTWLYQKITGTEAYQLGNRLFAHPAVPADKSDECIYFIYTLPDFK